MYLHLCGGRVENHLGKKTNTPNREFNPNLPVIGSPVYCECDALDHAATEATYNPVDELVNTWLAEGPKTDAVYFGKDEQSSSNTLRLPNYQAYISYCRESLVTSYVWGNSSTLRLYLTLDRELTPHLLETYLPTGLFVIISWGSFTVKPENVPGRMVLLVTNLLSLVTLFESVRNNSPAAMGIKCMDVWLVACILFIFLALVEYIAVLWKIRGPFFERKTSFIQNADTPITYKNAQKREATKEKVSYMCEFLRKCRKMLQYVYQTRPTSMWDPLDKISVFAFPFMFMICNAVYWPTYITMRSRLDLPSVCTDE
uniref:Neurotransmitter-gated ion-channel transmembrane domain-containing protein n=1 Tax=Timema bartmani TaxID=61472 RepID=A0A7R9EY23_9NEOP|nr:unnamed protein product [Timema bartmani]